MRKAIDTKQKEIETVTQKMVLPIDTDILRMRIQKDLENRFRLELETKGLEVERMTEAYYECKRQMDIYKQTLENSRFESDKAVQDMKERHKNELNELIEQNYQLQMRVDDQKDRDVVRSLRRDLEEYKRRCAEN